MDVIIKATYKDIMSDCLHFGIDENGVKYCWNKHKKDVHEANQEYPLWSLYVFEQIPKEPIV